MKTNSLFLGASVCYFLAAVLFLSGLALPASGQTALEEKFLQNVIAPTVLIGDDNGGGTGVRIHEDMPYYVTAAHVVLPFISIDSLTREITITKPLKVMEIYKQKPHTTLDYDVVKVWIDEDSDVAIVATTETAPKPAVNLPCKLDMKIGEEVWTVGLSGLEMHVSIDKGIYSGVSLDYPYKRYRHIFNLVIDSGKSGSGIFNFSYKTWEYELVGILNSMAYSRFSYSNSLHNQGYGSSIEFIIDLIKLNNIPVALPEECSD